MQTLLSLEIINFTNLVNSGKLIVESKRPKGVKKNDIYKMSKFQSSEFKLKQMICLLEEIVRVVANYRFLNDMPYTDKNTYFNLVHQFTEIGLHI